MNVSLQKNHIFSPLGYIDHLGNENIIWAVSHTRILIYNYIRGLQESLQYAHMAKGLSSDQNLSSTHVTVTQLLMSNKLI